jgi:DNA-binding NtrC family response regulator
MDRSESVSVQLMGDGDARRSRRASRVLVVDDELMIGRFVKNALAREHVEAFDSPRQALERAKVTAFDHVFCDLLMPEMNGVDFYHQLIEVRPEVAQSFTLMTGSAIGDELRRTFVEHHRIHLLHKPFGFVALVRSLHPE